MRTIIKGWVSVWTTHLFNLLRLRAKPLGNEYFNIKRVGNNVRVQAKQKLGSHGSIVMSKDAIEQVMGSTRAAAYDENAFFGISGNCLSVEHAITNPNLEMNQLIRRNSKTGHLHLNLEKKYESHGCLIFGSQEMEHVQLLALLKVRSTIEQIFGEIKSEALSVRTIESCVV